MLNNYKIFDDRDLILHEKYNRIKNDIHLSLHRSIDAGSAMEYFSESIVCQEDFI